MFVYRVLARLGCGPKYTVFRAVKNSKSNAFSHDIATSAVVGFCMESEQRKLHTLAREEAMLLVLLICVFSLCDLPINPDNWGTAGDRLVIVDFSFGQGHSVGLASSLSSPAQFAATIAKMVRDQDEQDADADADAPLPMERFFATYGKWLGSREAFSALLTSAMDDVVAWVNDKAQQREWRDATGCFGSIPLLRDLEQFQDTATRFFASWIQWSAAHTI